MTTEHRKSVPAMDADMKGKTSEVHIAAIIAVLDRLKRMLVAEVELQQAVLLKKPVNASPLADRRSGFRVHERVIDALERCGHQSRRLGSPQRRSLSEKTICQLIHRPNRKDERGRPTCPVNEKSAFHNFASSGAAASESAN